jgi:hypothetical protein
LFPFNHAFSVLSIPFVFPSSFSIWKFSEINWSNFLQNFVLSFFHYVPRFWKYVFLFFVVGSKA